MKITNLHKWLFANKNNYLKFLKASLLLIHNPCISALRICLPFELCFIQLLLLLVSSTINSWLEINSKQRWNNTIFFFYSPLQQKHLYIIVHDILQVLGNSIGKLCLICVSEREKTFVDGEREFFSFSLLSFFPSFTFQLMYWTSYVCNVKSPLSMIFGWFWTEERNKSKSAFWDQFFRQCKFFLIISEYKESRRIWRGRWIIWIIWMICVLPGIRWKDHWKLSAVYAHWLWEKKKKHFCGFSIRLAYVRPYFLLHENTRCSFKGRIEKCNSSLTCLKHCPPVIQKEKRKGFFSKNKGKEMSYKLSR